MPALVGTDLDRPGSATYSGFVDLIDLRIGVRGWAVDMADPMRPVLLELCLGDRPVAEALATGERTDISAKLGQPAVAGFEFDAGVMSGLPDFVDDPDEVLCVRVAATGHLLPYADQAPTAGDILARLRNQNAPAAATPTADFEVLLHELQANAATLIDLALRPLPENLQGYLETIALDSSGQVWFVGWMKRGHAQEFSAVVVERQKYPAAVAVMSYRRDDLPAEACGVVGLIASHWRPSSASAGVHLFFGEAGRCYLRSHEPLRILPSGELISEYENIRDRCLEGGRTTALKRMLTALEHWLPSGFAGPAFGTETSVDRVLLVPGLGCLVEGWAMSPVKRIEGLRLRIGASVMSTQPESLFWKPRLDLLDAFPGAERMAQRAGFVGLFSGEVDSENLADPILKLVFHGGGSAYYSIAPKVFRQLGHSASIDDALQFFPALQDEPFFPQFADAAIQAERTSMMPPVAITIARSRHAMVIVLPEDRCDLFLMFEEVAQRCRTGPQIEALAFVAASRSNRSDALWLFREFQSAHGTPRGIACSLLVIDDASQAFALLPDILREIGASRFFFAGHGIVLNPAGWAWAQQALSSSGTDLAFFGIAAEAFERQTAADAVSARCFAWSASLFSRWSLGAPAFMGGYYRDNTLQKSSVAQTIHHDAARLMRAIRPTRLQDAVNAAVYARAAHAWPAGAEVLS